MPASFFFFLHFLRFFDSAARCFFLSWRFLHFFFFETGVEGGAATGEGGAKAQAGATDGGEPTMRKTAVVYIS